MTGSRARSPPLPAKGSSPSTRPRTTMARGGLALALVLFSLGAPLAAATPWLETGGGPERSYSVEGSVPAVEEVALRVELPSPLSGCAGCAPHEPVVLDG